MPKLEKVVPDTSIIIQGVLGAGEWTASEIVIHEAALAELEHQANQGRASGYVGLDEVKRLGELAKQNKFVLRVAGRRPTFQEVRMAASGEVDALIRQLAWEEDATLLTSDKVQARVGEARGVKVAFVPQKEYCPKKLLLDEFFDDTTMSVHLREQVVPMAKRGAPGSWKFVEVGKQPLAAEKIKEISREIVEEAGCRSDGFLEIQREGSTIVQLGHYRIVVLRPPFSDGWEITAVRPVRKLRLADYKLSEKLQQRVGKQAEGILIAGAPGMGKSTFAQALAEFYAEQGRIVKTVEAPRDMVLPETITQLAISRGSAEEVHDVLLLSRPDYSLFDEMRNVPDFLLYADMRLAGVGMVGVVHGTNPLDAIQRFIGKIDLGVIPHVIDTVAFIKHGTVDTVLTIRMEVKVPAGMTEADLARPTVVISDFETGKQVAEIYTYGEETVVIPVEEQEQRGAKALAARQIERFFERFVDAVKVEVLSDSRAAVYVPKRSIPGVIGRGGERIQELEEELGIGLDVRELEEAPRKKGKELPFQVKGGKKNVEFNLGQKHAGKAVDVFVDGEFVATVPVSGRGMVKVKKQTQFGKMVINALDRGKKVAFHA